LANQTTQLKAAGITPSFLTVTSRRRQHRPVMTGRNSKPATSANPDILTTIVSQVLSAGATEFEVEYKDGHEEICVMRGPIGFGIASLKSSSKEAQELRAQLYKLRKPRKLRIDGIDYLLRGEIFDSFGEDAFRVKVSRNGR
jgi:hypothetical protein